MDRPKRIVCELSGARRRRSPLTRSSPRPGKEGGGQFLISEVPLYPWRRRRWAVSYKRSTPASLTSSIGTKTPLELWCTVHGSGLRGFGFTNVLGVSGLHSLRGFGSVGALRRSTSGGRCVSCISSNPCTCKNSPGEQSVESAPGLSPLLPILNYLQAWS